MPAATKMSSQPSALRSSTLGPQGQYVSTPRESDTSSNRPPPRFAKSALPKMKPAFPAGKKSAGGRAGHGVGGLLPPTPGGRFDPKRMGAAGSDQERPAAAPQLENLAPPP